MDRHLHRAFAAFCFLWAAATLFHIASFDKWGDSLQSFLLATAALALLIRPRSVPLLLFLATIQVYGVAVDLPQVSNHWLFTAFVNLTILASWGVVAIRRTSFAVAPDALLRTFAPLVRIELVALYFFVVLHKLNADYFDRETSCGAGFWLQHADRFPFLPEGSAFQVGSLYLTVAIEAAIPMLLCTKRGRNAGILLALTFHTVIGFNPVSGFYNFSSMLYAVLFLFAPEDIGSRVVDLWRDLRTRAQGPRRRVPPFSLRVALLYASVAALGLVLLNALDKAVEDHFLLIWTAYSACVVTLFAALLLRGGSRRPIGGRLFEVKHPALACLPVVVALNGLSPYLGLKTESSFAMFSNLRTEGKRSNHLFIPAGTQIFGFQDDLVEVTSSSSPVLQGLADRGELVPWFEFRSQASAQPEAAVSYVRNGAARTVRRIADAPELAELPRARKLLVFRPVPKEGPQECRH
jgi:hypothetical protein